MCAEGFEASRGCRNNRAAVPYVLPYAISALLLRESSLFRADAKISTETHQETTAPSADTCLILLGTVKVLRRPLTLTTQDEPSSPSNLLVR